MWDHGFCALVILLFLTSSKAQNEGNDTDKNKFDLSLCTIFYFYEHCYLDDNVDDYDLTIDIDYVWGLFESTRESEVDKIIILKRIRSYMKNYDLLDNIEKLNTVPNRTVFCFRCKEITNNAGYYFDVADDLVKYFSPVLIAVGTVGNVLCFLMMMRRSMRDSVICTQIAVIAVCDTLNLWYGDFLFYLEKTHGIHITDLSSAGCKSAETIQNALLLLSCWLITFMSVERFIAVFFPLKSKLYLKKKTILIVSLILALLAFGMNIPSILVPEIRPHKDHYHCFVKEDKIVFNQDVLMAVSVMLSYVPFFIILFANFGIIFKLSCNRGDLGQQTANVQTTSMTISLVVVSFVFLIVTFPITFFNFGETVMYTTDHPEVRGARFYLYNMIAHCMMYLNYGINFYLYLITGARFRSELGLMMREFGGIFCKSCVPDESLHSSVTQSSVHERKSKDTSDNSVWSEILRKILVPLQISKNCNFRFWWGNLSQSKTLTQSKFHVGFHSKMLWNSEFFAVQNMYRSCLAILCCLVLRR